ncbi:MAG: hypothetical protein N2557_01115 [Hydrogenophilus sp.]|nr:hypothetical protein [Hydrogenophilus sp.]
MIPAPIPPHLLGHLLLIAAFLLLLWFPALWEAIGVGAFLLWMVIAAFGVYFLTQRDDHSPPFS